MANKAWHCVPLGVEFCARNLRYNATAYPNLAGHAGLRELAANLVAWRQIADFECYGLARELVCQLLQPECEGGRLRLPCRDFCLEFWEACKSLLPEEVAKSINCKNFPHFVSPESCKPKPGCANELVARGHADHLCDAVVDCSDFSDEISCDYCHTGQFYCGGRQCVTLEQRCDNRTDCDNGADERNCLSLAPDRAALAAHHHHSEGLLYFTDRGQLGKVCADPATRPAVLRTLAVAACSAMHYRVTENVEVRPDPSPGGLYVSMEDPLAQSVTFTRTTCPSQTAVYVKCGGLVCGVRPAHAVNLTTHQQPVAAHGQWPWAAVLLRHDVHACDATLVSPEWLLTSGSCFHGHSQAEWRSRLGVVRLGASPPYEQARRVVGLVRAPGGQLALVRLATPLIASDFVRPACLPEPARAPPLPRDCATLAWGMYRRFKGQMVWLMQLTASYARSQFLQSGCTVTLHPKPCSAPSRPPDCGQELKDKELGGQPLFCLHDSRWYLVGISATPGPVCGPRAWVRLADHSQWVAHTLDTLHYS
ncbi:hypothetical protein LAZ67_9000617 [Cordylochernes scorpioides]|uniref:Atrial natriuretic peptide-converting enzyme n=1 Tax=Cordylochernes scorpioides TaxID=51811 RepID=A0ABY6KSM0_9ARAC|nr:hypothetical protein LAZ67_9000617 [Cordylochernes scorpioides]